VTVIREQIATDLPIQAAFDFVADFANAAMWDPGVASSRRAVPADQPVGVGTTFELGVRIGGQVAPMTYRIDRFERPDRVVLVGGGSGVDAVDDIRFTRSGTGTVIDYTADIRLRGIRRLIQPFLGGTFRRIGRDAADGMSSRLAAMATAAGVSTRDPWVE
jgi:carbon monoxide dehydrogenase subunit G